MSNVVSCLSDIGLTWSPVAEQRIGCGRVVWLAVAPANDQVTSAKAESEMLRFEETGSVPSVRIVSRARGPVVVAANLLLRGGLQTRVVERSLVLGPSAEAVVPVRCVERRRWAPRQGDRHDSFQAGTRLSVRASATLTRAKADSMRATGVYEASQRQVWAEVDAELERERVRSATASYEAVSHVRGRRVGAVRAQMDPPRGANGMLVLPDAGGAWFEAFATPETLAESAPEVAADLSEPPAAEARVARRVPSIADALDWIWRRRVVTLPAVAGTLGSAFALASSRASGEVLLLDGALAHAMVSASLGVGR